ncbi:CDI toxin immunity protein [Paenibacillus sp. KN14-4R]|uniref:CDI toxin immunity protein n=1 Tax=Paenibacillus sp. KN14-4R TaxID=3445773 RepID=UPI003F9F3E4E
MTLFEECIEALDGSSIILNEIEAQEEFNRFKKVFSFSYGRIDWSQVEEKESIKVVSDVLNRVNNIEGDFLIIWDNARLPIVKSNLDSIFNSLDDVLAVSFDTWLYRPEDGTIIEFFHEGDITIGKV